MHIAEIVGVVLLLLGLASSAALAYYPLRNRKLMPKKWAVVAIVVGVLSQIVNQAMQSHQQRELKNALTNSEVAVKEQTNQLKEQGQKLTESHALIKRLSLDVKSQSLKQEASLYVLNQSVSDLTAKAVPYGSGGYGTGRYGGEAGPLERIADSMVGLYTRFREYLDHRELIDIRFDPKMQCVKYLQYVREIPSEYDDAAWRAAEENIFQLLSDEIQSNLIKRGIYTQESYSQYVSVLKAERSRMMQLRARRKN